MKAKHRHDMIDRLAEIQQLKVAREKLHLVDRQMQTRTAAEAVEECKQELHGTRNKLDQLLSEQIFCPTNYRITCETLLIAETNVEESNRNLDTAEKAEDDQRLQWHQSRLQADWLEEESRRLAIRVARDADNKRAVEAIGLVWNLQETRG